MGSYLSQPVTCKTTESGAHGDLRFAVASMQGWRKTQEDAHLASVGIGDGPYRNSALFGVFDGHGGPEVAKFCSRHFENVFVTLEDFQGGDYEQSLKQAFHRMDDMLRNSAHAEEIEKLKEEGNEELIEEESEDEPADPLELLRKMFVTKRLEDKQNGTTTEGNDPALIAPENRVQAGCTAVVAFKHNDDLYVSSAGDSRCVLSRDGKAVALSEDHKPAQEREKSRIIAAGGFLSVIGGVCRVNGNLNLSRAIGDLQYKTNPNLPSSDQIITAEPDVTHTQLSPEDEFLVLACDGVWDVMSNQQVVDFVRTRLKEGQAPTDISCDLLDQCLANDPKEARGIGCDNMTCIVVQLK